MRKKKVYCLLIIALIVVQTQYGREGRGEINPVESTSLTSVIDSRITLDETVEGERIVFNGYQEQIYYRERSEFFRKWDKLRVVEFKFNEKEIKLK